MRNSAMVLILALAPALARSSAAEPVSEPVKVALCDLAAHPEAYDGKLVRVRALVDTGVQDLPSGLTDDHCGYALKFFTPDDPELVRLAKSKEFQKLVKQVKKNPVVEATVTGQFKQAAPGQGADQKPVPGLALVTVEDVLVHRQPRVRNQNR